LYRFRNTILFGWLKNIFVISFILSACTIPRKYQKNKPFVFKNNIEIKGGNFSAEERSSLKQKMLTQLDDSMKTKVKDFVFLLHTIKEPPAYDSSYAGISARNMKNTLLHLGYYGANAGFKADTAIISEEEKRVSVTYSIEAGNPTLIDTFSYRLQKPELEQLALSTQKESFLSKTKPVTRDAVLSEITRLVELYRNHGYYKFTSEDIKMRGDTTIAALTNISDDPFENIQLLAEANEKRNKPTIKLALVLNPAIDTQRIKKYYINNVYVYPDFTSADIDTTLDYKETNIDNFIVRYHKEIIRNEFLKKNLLIKKGGLYRQMDYSKTISNFSRTGVWQNVDIQIKELKDSTDKLDMIVRLVPAKKYGFEANIEASYSSTNSNNVSVANAGNLLGFSTNLSLQNRNLAKRAIKMTHAIRAGVELNLNAGTGSGEFLNSNELSYTNTISIPKLLFPFKAVNESKLSSAQTFFSTGISNSNRIGLFKLNSLAFGMGYEFNFSPNQTLTVKPFNIEYSNLYDRSKNFDQTLLDNPYLRYSFNTALVIGSTVGYSLTTVNQKHPSRINSFKVNFEESGALVYFVFPLDKIGFLNRDLRKYLKLDVENTYTISNKRSAIALHLFGGVGIPVGKKDTTLPFFKQYFGGGPNSMRAWPIRGIGPGSKAQPGFKPGSTLTDRTGDIRLEANLEYRHDLFQIIPNSLTLKWALFADVGNIWNYRNTIPGGGYDSTQFQFKNLYKQLGVALGTGLRLDFNYVLMRFDLGFRFKRPELAENNGWKAPSIGFNDLFGKLFTAGPNGSYKKWRYENFNFSIGLSYPF
jgi:outer membrane protein insertion porin family